MARGRVPRGRDRLHVPSKMRHSLPLRLAFECPTFWEARLAHHVHIAPKQSGREQWYGPVHGLTLPREPGQLRTWSFAEQKRTFAPDSGQREGYVVN